MANPTPKPRKGKYYHCTMTGRVVYDRRIHTFTIRDVIRILTKLNFEFRDILLVREMVEDLWDALRRWLEGLLAWVREQTGLSVVKWILKFLCSNQLSLLRNVYPWNEEDLISIDAARDFIEGL